METASPDLLSLECARDAAFSHYGELQRFTCGTGRALASIDSRLPEEGVGFVGDLDGDSESDILGSLRLAEAWLRARGVSRVQGPITRHTWYPFRAVTSGFEAWSRLPGEPWNHPELGPTLERAGYEPLVHSISTWTDDLEPLIRSCARKLEATAERGIRVRPLAPDNLMSDLQGVHSLINHTFAPPENHLFHPIGFPEFLLVLGLIPGQAHASPSALDPRLILVAEHEGRIIGLVYGVLQPGSDGALLAGIKTLAVAPAFAGAGVGGALAAELHRRAREYGVVRVAHLLMRTGGPATTLSASGRTAAFRKYAVYEKHLES